MNTPPAKPAFIEAHGLPGELFTVDADAHLEKLAAHMFPSPALLPVELLRSALKRGASSVSIDVKPGRIVISDDGRGIHDGEWLALARLGDAAQGPAAREKAMATIQDRARPSIGLLSVFLPGWHSIEIEDAGEHERRALRLLLGRGVRMGAGARSRGTQITIHRSRGPARDEIELLARLCADVAADITLNSRALAKKPLLGGRLVSMNVGPEQKLPQGQLSIPARGDVCRLWLLDQSIPWQVTNRSAARGLVFAAALETPVTPSASLLESLSVQADRLYYWLAENYARFPVEHQGRIEELFFRRIRSGGDPGLLTICAPFLAWPGPQRLTLADICRQAAHGALPAMDMNGRFNRFSGRDGKILLLSAAQKDFLIDHLRLPVTFLNEPRRSPEKSLKLLAFFRESFGRFLERLFPPVPVESSRVSMEEMELCRRLEAQWRLERARNDPGAPLAALAVRLVEGRGWAPARGLKTGNGEILQLRRRHPLTRRALRRVNQDAMNAELALAAVMPAHFLTGR
jgi:hypothetical protein